MREQWADIAKGIGILSVIIGHLEIDYINAFVFTYHLPVFFILSGYYLRPKQNGVFIKEKAKSLLLPYYTTGMMISISSVLVGIVMRFPEKKTTFISWILAMLYGAGNDGISPFSIRGIGAIWFLWALFFALIIVNFSVQRKLSWIFIIFSAYMGWFSSQILPFWLPLSIQAGLLAVIYVYVGWVARKYNSIDLRITNILLGVAIPIWIWGITHFKGFWLVVNFLGNGVMDIVTSLCGAYVIFRFSMAIEKYVPLIRQFLVFCGRNSLIILSAHIIELNTFPWGILIEFLCNRFGLSYEFALYIIFVFKVIWCIVVVGLVYKVPLLKSVYFPTKSSKNVRHI